MDPRFPYHNELQRRRAQNGDLAAAAYASRPHVRDGLAAEQKIMAPPPPPPPPKDDRRERRAILERGAYDALESVKKTAALRMQAETAQASRVYGGGSAQETILTREAGRLAQAEYDREVAAARTRIVADLERTLVARGLDDASLAKPIGGAK